MLSKCSTSYLPILYLPINRRHNVVALGLCRFPIFGVDGQMHSLFLGWWTDTKCLSANDLKTPIFCNNRESANNYHQTSQSWCFGLQEGEKLVCELGGSIPCLTHGAFFEFLELRWDDHCSSRIWESSKIGSQNFQNMSAQEIEAKNVCKIQICAQKVNAKTASFRLVLFITHRCRHRACKLSFDLCLFCWALLHA